MKYLTVIALLFALGACSSAEDKRQERQEDARAEYEKQLEEANAEYDEEVSEEQKEEAEDMIDDAEKVDVDKDEGRIDVEN